MASQSSSVLAEAGLVLLLSASIVVPCLAAGESSIGAAECQRSCGDVEIPFPFGIGPDHCWLPGFELSCADTGNGVLKPFMVGAVVEVLHISVEKGEALVLHPISSYCYNATDLSDTAYSFSNTANKFTVVGCRTLAYIGDIRGNNAYAMYQTGCVSMCFRGSNLDINSPCSGMECCQMAIPQGLQYYHVWFDQSVTMGLYGSCSFAVLMMDSYSLLNLSTSDLGWSSSDFSNISTGFNTSLGGTAPVVLDWSIGHDGCKIAGSSACVSGNSLCKDSASGRGYNCNCTKGYEGNPYIFVLRNRFVSTYRG